MPQATQLVISLTSKRGAMSRVASALGSAGVNIKGFLAPEVSPGRQGKQETSTLVSSYFFLTSTKLESQRRPVPSCFGHPMSFTAH